MKNHLFIIFISLLFACDESEEMTNKTECDAALTVMNRAADKFASLTDSGTETKVDCLDLVEKMNDYLPCMAEGANKVEFESAIVDFSELCSELDS